MHFNYKEEYAKFMAEWTNEEKLLRSQNASDELIEEIYRFSLSQFNSYRRYYRHKEDLNESYELGQEQELDNGFDFLETIDNPVLLKGLLKLKKQDLELIILYAKGYTEKEIALKYGHSQPNISKKLARIKKYLKNIL